MYGCGLWIEIVGRSHDPSSGIEWLMREMSVIGFRKVLFSTPVFRHTFTTPRNLNRFRVSLPFVPKKPTKKKHLQSHAFRQHSFSNGWLKLENFFAFKQTKSFLFKISFLNVCVSREVGIYMNAMIDTERWALRRRGVW